MMPAITAIKAALEAKDEPVACRACNGSGRMVRDPDIGTDQECFVCEGSKVFEDTTPPQRKPLTDEELREAFERWQTENFAQNLEQYGHTYKNMHVRCRWQGWLAAHGIIDPTDLKGNHDA